MKPTLILLILSAVAFSSCPAQKSEEKLVEKSFKNYKSAILNDKGEEAVNFVDSRTVAYYQKISDLVKTADSAAVQSLSILDRFMVLAIRHRAAKDDILSFDGKKLLVYAIQKGMVGKGSVADVSIGKVIVDGNFAKGEFVVKGEVSPAYFHFYKEDGQWKASLTSLFAFATGAFTKMVEERGGSENDFLFLMMELTSGKKAGVEVWQPVK